MIDKYLKLLASKIDDKVSQLQMSIADGKAEDFAEYKKMCGEVKGLLTARLYIIDLQERVNHDDDDEWDFESRHNQGRGFIQDLEHKARGEG